MSTPAASPSLPADLAAAHAMILAERAKRIEAEAAASSVEATIAHLKLMIEKLRRELYGQRSERTARLIDQMELQLEELEARATEDEIVAQRARAWRHCRRPLHAGGPRASPSRSICRASASSCRPRPLAHAAAR